MALLPDWPPWALYTFLGLALLTGSTAVLEHARERGEQAEAKSKPSGEQLPAFRKFQRQYLLVYGIIMMADWFQGTNMYTLYMSYGVNISALFLSGFLSGAVFAGPVGIYIDRYGRRLSCMVYLVLEIVINICEHFNNFPVPPASHEVHPGLLKQLAPDGSQQLLGVCCCHLLLQQKPLQDTEQVLWTSRILGGITTCILFTGFEAWMVSEHRKGGFPEAWMADTFSKASFINGLSAIVAGILAQLCADALGEIGPFQAAIALTALALVFVVFWPENYGGGGDNDGDSKQAAWQLIRTDRKAFLLGSVNALFEGSMYSFVFMWVPTMLGALKGSPLPNGLVFASLMTCISLGGLLFSPSMLLTLVPAEYLGVGCFLIGASALVVPVFTNEVVPVLGAFLVFETCVGVFQPCGGVLRSKVIPDKLQGSVMNLFRVPLNTLVVVGTLLTDYYPARFVFGIITVWMLLGAGLQVAVIQALAKEDGSNKRD